MPDGLREGLRSFQRWVYREGRPNTVGRVLNRLSATLHSAGLWPERLATLEVSGRRSGRTITFPVVLADLQGERYLVSMLGENANWVRNVRATRGRAVLRHGRREPVRLDEIPPDERPPVLRRYLAVAPGARPHFPTDSTSDEFERVAARTPIFHITTET